MLLLQSPHPQTSRDFDILQESSALLPFHNAFLQPPDRLSQANLWSLQFLLWRLLKNEFLRQHQRTPLALLSCCLGPGIRPPKRCRPLRAFRPRAQPLSLTLKVRQRHRPANLLLHRRRPARRGTPNHPAILLVSQARPRRAAQARPRPG
ncbi:hypothetical protein MPH_10018 [Macrophomina phaseolina MS6]|uniref:Uncharacterized protein n=1 Tax=Macrophomina phaseolina (strain MS6) TaxID=1126212 RepID=K2S7C6_MACPH|nr:hypothetical protein MPH_10018 [Macrophomina phaseolina MS6]